MKQTYGCLVNIYAACINVMMGWQRNALNAQIWGNYERLGYDGTYVTSTAVQDLHNFRSLAIRWTECIMHLKIIVVSRQITAKGIRQI